MVKKILITLVIIINTGAVYAQQYTAKDLIGRWQEVRNKKINICFLTDSTAAWIMNDGLLHYKINYTTRLDKDIIRLKYTPEIDREKPGTSSPILNF
ncbi:hypothetical protein HK413_09630 [Mucilaginibacter sp. S1162]|uniref:Lipocalin-like domain-containing protein n=1 Tax=Mucilaginibacter humi TaxID=2732510 RepID=A0ABX1W4W8_9SPHI|nr:hypothetical protein [Mucilaginibacter humi]NNU34339.1 hypothetical protein [Mucilaginibacter humi]